jgi:hypothetical protein
LTCCSLDNHCDYYYLTLLVIYEHLNILAMFCYNLHPAQPEEDWSPLRAWFLSRFIISTRQSQKRTGPPLIAWFLSTWHSQKRTGPPLRAWFLSTWHSQKRTGHPTYPGSSQGFFLGFGLSREFSLATVLLHLHCLLFGVLGWVSVQHFETSADVRRAS